MRNIVLVSSSYRMHSRPAKYKDSVSPTMEDDGLRASSDTKNKSFIPFYVLECNRPHESSMRNLCDDLHSLLHSMRFIPFVHQETIESSCAK